MNEQDTKSVEAPDVSEIAKLEDGMTPLMLDSLRASTPYVNLLETTDAVLKGKGGIANLSVYTELLRDDQVATCWSQRRLALTHCDTVVEAGAEDAQSKAAAEALQDEIDALPWDDITDKALFAAFYGWGVSELIWRVDGARVAIDAVRVRDRGRFRFDRDRGLHLWTSGSGWVQMPDRKFWTMVSGGDNHDQLYGLGVASALYWPVFFKRNDIKFWLIFLEKFGQPTAIAKMPTAMIASTDKGPDGKTNRQRALEMLRSIATDAGVLVPANDQGESIVELLEAARSGAADYESMHKVMNEAISKIILGQTMTTDDGSSRAQGEVHERVAQRIVKADADLLCGSFNASAVRWWSEWNFPGATPPRVYRHTEPQEDLGARAERDTKIKALGWEPTEEYMRETYGDGWVKAKPPQQAPGMMPPRPGMPPGDQQGGQEDGGQQFAESEAAALQALRAARRGDQQALLDAAVHFAEQYETIMGRQVGALLQAAEDSGDPDVFRQRLDEILSEQPAPEAVEKISRAGLFARMLGALRHQRRAA